MPSSNIKMKTEFRFLINNLSPTAKHFSLVYLFPPCPLRLCLENCTQKPHFGGGGRAHTWPFLLQFCYLHLQSNLLTKWVSCHLYLSSQLMEISFCPTSTKTQEKLVNNDLNTKLRNVNNDRNIRSLSSSPSIQRQLGPNQRNSQSRNRC